MRFKKAKARADVIKKEALARHHGVKTEALSFNFIVTLWISKIKRKHELS